MSRTAMCFLLLTAARRVDAQDVVASSFDQLRLALRLGDTISVKDATGNETKAKLAELSSTSLRLTNENRAFSEEEIREVHLHDHAKVSTGAKWGLGIGAGLGVATMLQICGGAYSYCGGEAWAFALAYGGLGAGLGAGIAALIPTKHLVYAHPGNSATRLTVSPFVTRERKGVSVSLGFGTTYR